MTLKSPQPAATWQLWCCGHLKRTVCEVVPLSICMCPTRWAGNVAGEDRGSHESFSAREPRTMRWESWELVSTGSPGESVVGGARIKRCAFGSQSQALSSHCLTCWSFHCFPSLRAWAICTDPLRNVVTPNVEPPSHCFHQSRFRIFKQESHFQAKSEY